MNQGNKPASPFKAGMYLLDSFTSGMYNDPLIVYREYIQNAVDSIDLAQGNDQEPLTVSIQLEPGTRQITIRDNATGVPSALAQSVLSAIGSSNKADQGVRGFRGIGRLGGIAFSDRAVFRTKAKNETVESIQEWDCRSLRKLLAEQKKESLSLEEVFHRVTTFRQEDGSQTDDSFFEVTLSGVSSFRNQIFDMERVRRYLSQVAPVQFDTQEFSHAPLIDQYLSLHLSGYGRYTILLNGEPVFKPYKDTVRITKGDGDHIEGIEFFEITNGRDRPIGYGWYGRRRELLGSIARGDDSSGVRVRVGNIQIGDAHLLDFCFREPRFNSYVTGEIHVECPDLIPNSRRDDFVDNHKKGQFYNLVEREIGLPISKEIRARSRQASIAGTALPPKAVAGSFPVTESQTAESPCATSPCLEGSEEESPRPDKEIFDTPEQEIVPGNEPTALDAAVVTKLRRLCQGCPKLAKLLIALEQEEG